MKRMKSKQMLCLGLMLLLLLSACSAAEQATTTPAAATAPVVEDVTALPLGEPAEELITGLGLSYEGDSGATHYSLWSEDLPETAQVDGVRLNQISYQVEDGVLRYVSHELNRNQFDSEEAFVAAVASWHTALDETLTATLPDCQTESTLGDLLSGGTLTEGRQGSMWFNQQYQVVMYVTARPGVDGGLSATCEVLYLLAE